MLSPDREILELASKVRLVISSDRAEDSTSLASAEMEFESATSVCSSHDDKTHEEILEVVSHAVARIQLEHNTSRRHQSAQSYMTDFCQVARGRGLSVGLYLHDELTHSWGNPYSSRVFVPLTSTYLTIVGANTRSYMMMHQVEEILAGYLYPGSASSARAPLCLVTPLMQWSAPSGRQTGTRRHLISFPELKGCRPPYPNPVWLLSGERPRSSE